MRKALLLLSLVASTMALAQPANDTYATAELITLSASTTCTTSVTSGSTAAATTDATPVCSGAVTPAKDVWYKFTPTNPTAVIRLTNVTLVTGAGTNMFMQLFRGSNTNPVLCVNGNEMVLDGSNANRTLLSGTTYYLRIYNADGFTENSFNICSSIPPPPVNDHCGGAINVPVNSGNESAFVSATNVGATITTTPALGCPGTASHDVWFRFNAPSSGRAFVRIFNSRTLVNAGAGSPSFAVYGGSCVSLAEIECSNQPGGNVSGLTPGATYYIRVFDVPGNQFAFDLSLQEIPPIPTNISCATAQMIDTPWVQGTTLGLPTTSVTPCGGGSATSNREVWYRFTAETTKHLVDFKDMVRLSQDQNSLGYKLYAGTCAALTDITCVPAVQFGNSLATGLTVGNTYYIQVLENPFNGGPVSYKIRAFRDVPPENDDVFSATPLLQSPDCQNAAGTFKLSTVSADALSGSFSGDVWYSFVAASTDPQISINASSGVYIQVYENNGTTVFYDPGFATGSIQLTGAIIGSTYYVRVYNQGASTLTSAADFSICIFGLPSTDVADQPTPGNTCVTIDGPVVSNSSLRWLHLTHQGKMVASVFDNPGNTGMGNIIGRYYINSGNVRSDASGIEYLNRNFEITPTVQPDVPVSVRLYFSKAEFDALVQANDGDGNDVFYLNDLKISKFSSNACSNTLNLAGEVLYNINGWGMLSDNVYYVQFVVPSFSSFFLKNVNGILPATCVDFKAERKSYRVQLEWTTASETNTERFELQRSIDGRNFIKLADVNGAGNSTLVTKYTYVDEKTLPNTTYFYRLLSIDKDGAQQFTCKTVKVAVEEDRKKLFGNVYPNPAKETLTVQLQRGFAGNAGFQVISATGQVLQEKTVSISTVDAAVTLNIAAIPAGVYVLRIQTSNGVETIRFTKQ